MWKDLIRLCVFQKTYFRRVIIRLPEMLRTLKLNTIEANCLVKL